MTVPLLPPRDGDSQAIPIPANQNPIETRNPTNLSPHNNPCHQYTNPIHLDLSILREIKSQAREAIRESKSLSIRLASVRARLISHLDEDHNVPPDRGPPLVNQRSTAILKCRFEEEDEALQTAREEEKKQKPITSFNRRSNETQLMIAEGPILQDGGEMISTSSFSKHHTPPHPELNRCSRNCLMASRGNNPRSGEDLDAPFRRRAGKEVAGSSAGAEKNILVVDMAGARQAMRSRFLAVGLFLSVLLANSQQVIEHMKRVWKIRGRMEANPLAAEEGRKFILEFSEEGDRDHVVRGGPWQYKGDAFLVDPLEEGADPASVLFTHVPMWVQFRKIPGNLLTKKLAYDLGNRVGTTKKIDNCARGSIDDKFIRARVQLPLYIALQKEVTLVDGTTGVEVDAQLRYERLPNFCLFCGFIEHMEARCDTSTARRKLCFSQDLRVPPVYFDDHHAWFLPDTLEQAVPVAAKSGPWRAPKPSPATFLPAVVGAVEGVLEHVARLSVDDTSSNNNKSNATGENAGVQIAATLNTNMGSAVVPDSGTGGVKEIVNTLAVIANTASSSEGPHPPLDTDTGAVGAGNIDNAKSDQVLALAVGAADYIEELPLPLDTNTGAAGAMCIDNNNGAATAWIPVVVNENVTTRTPVNTPSINFTYTKGWRRKKREGGEEPSKNLPTILFGGDVGKVRLRHEEEAGDEDEQQQAKRRALHVPTLEECLGRDGLRKIKDAELNNGSVDTEGSCKTVEEEGASSGGSVSATHAENRGKEKEKEASGPGAAGNLTDAEEGGRQEQ